MAIRGPLTEAAWPGQAFIPCQELPARVVSTSAKGQRGQEDPAAARGAPTGILRGAEPAVAHPLPPAVAGQSSRPHAPCCSGREFCHGG